MYFCINLKSIYNHDVDTCFPYSYLMLLFLLSFCVQSQFLLSFAYFPTFHYRLTFWSVSLEECKIIPLVNIQSQDKDKSEDFLGDIELSDLVKLRTLLNITWRLDFARDEFRLGKAF